VASNSLHNALTLPPLPDGWTYQELGDLLEPDGLSYGVVQPGSHDPEGVPILRVKNLRGGKISTDDILRVANDIEQKHHRTRLRGGEVLLSLVGSVGEVAVVPASLAGWNVARAIAVIRVSSDVSSSWIKLCLSTDLARRCMGIWQTDTVQATLNLRDVRRLPIVMPPKLEREAIAAVLGALDDKIAVNERIMTTSHELAQALAARVLADSPRVPLAEIATITMGSSPPGHTYNDAGIGMPFYQGARDFGSRFPKRRVWCTEPVRLAQPGSTLVSVRAPVGRLNVAIEQCCIGRGLAALTSKNQTPSVLFHTLSFASEIWQPFESEGTVFGAINKAQLEGLLVPALDPPSCHELEATLSSLDDLVRQRFMENATLAELRDTLLPKLISGELRVRDAEKAVEEAL